jgi:DNA-binding transcriptional ArsR family regulator
MECPRLEWFDNLCKDAAVVVPPADAGILRSLRECHHFARIVTGPRMQTDPLSAEIAALLRERIEDYEQFEILRLLQSDRTASWTVNDIVERLKLNEERIAAGLNELEKGELIRSGQRGNSRRFSFAPATAELGLVVEQLIALYQVQPTEIIKHMSANAIERVRTAALHAFADAFVIRRNKDNG